MDEHKRVVESALKALSRTFEQKFPNVTTRPEDEAELREYCRANPPRGGAGERVLADATELFVQKYIPQPVMLTKMEVEQIDVLTDKDVHPLSEAKNFVNRGLVRVNKAKSDTEASFELTEIGRKSRLQHPTPGTRITSEEIEEWRHDR